MHVDIKTNQKWKDKLCKDLHEHKGLFGRKKVIRNAPGFLRWKFVELFCLSLTQPWFIALDCKIQPVNPKGNQSWIFIGRTDAEADTPILWPPDAKSWFIWKDLMLGKIEDRRRRRRQRMRWLYGIINSVDMSLSSRRWWWTGRPDVLQYLGSQS